MKKSVIVLMAVIYIISIAIVSFFGLKIDTYNAKSYVEKVEITNEDVKYDYKNEKYVVINYVADDNGIVSYQLNWRVYPDNATNKSVKFVYDEQRGIASVNKFGTVIFNKKGVVTVEIKANDGSSKSDKITIYAK